MRPLSLKLSGFIGIRSGLNRESVEVDLRGYRGVVVLKGPNGAGKTTLIDNMTPFRIMPFRADGYSEGQFSYYEETVGEAEKVLEWEHLGARYKSQILIHGRSKKMEAYLFVDQGGVWKPFRAADGTISDGKSSTYDVCVHSLLGTPELYFTAFFAKQERKKLADYKAGDIKLLLSDLLGLDHLLELAKRAGAQADKLHDQIEAGQPAVRAFEAAGAEQTTLSTRVAAATSEAARTAGAQVQTREALTVAQQRLAESRAQALALDENRRRRAAAQAVLLAVEREQSEAQRKLQRDLDAAAQHGAAPELVADINTLQIRIRALQQRLEGLQARYAAIPDAEAARVEQADATVQEAAQAAAMAAAEAALAAAALPVGHVTAAALKAKRDGLVARGGGDAAALEKLELRAALVERVPCASLDINAKCELLADARGAQADVQPAKEALDKLRTDCRELNGKINAALVAEKAQAEAQAAVERQREDYRVRIRPALDRAAQRAAAAAGASEVCASIEQAKTDLAAAQGELDAKRQAAAARVREGDERALQVQADHSTTAQALEARLEAAKADLTAIPADDPSRLGADEHAVQQAELGLSHADAAAAAAQRELATAQARLQEVDARVQEGAGAAQRIQELASDMAQWRLLAKGLGRDGIVALAIDDAGPSISSISNDLLTTCYGPRFSARFDTQRETQAGTLKETFDIIVFDAERDEKKSAGKLSGGERIWVNDAITKAVALFKAQQSGRNVQALFSDESDGALDDDRKVRYMRMKRRVLELGGFDVEYCITHTPALWEMADAVLDVGAMRLS